MDVAYDHIQEDSFSPTSEKPTQHPPTTSGESTTDIPAAESRSDLKAELSSAFKAAASSQWGTTLGSWFSSARQQGQSFYQDLQKEASEASEQATKGFSSLREEVAKRTRSLSLSAPGVESSVVPGEEALPIPKGDTEGEKDASADAAAEAEALQGDKPESLPADIVKEAGTLVASLRSTAASKLKDLQRAEDAADEALLKFGTNIRNFLRDAVVITAPDDDAAQTGSSEVLFETQEPGTGKKVFHSTRLDAQLHAIHTTATSFTQDPADGAEWEKWRAEFDVDKQTEEIARDLDKYEELRRAMEKLVPEKVDYKTCWMRYYFLRKAVEEEEQRRKEVLKGAANDTTEEVAWDDEEEEEPSSTPNAVKSSHAASASTTTLTQTTLKPEEPRRSHEDAKSVADSDASYDIVSGTASRATGSPKEEKRSVRADSDDDDDWE